MKHSVLFILCLFTLAGMHAQGIRTGSKWNVGSMDYTAKVNPDRTITFSATAEGEELAFRLTPTPGKTDEYTIGTDPNSDGFNPFEKSTRAKFINQQGWRLLCLYDANNYLLNILDATQSINGEKVAVGKWMEQISGKYIDHYGDITKESFYQDWMGLQTGTKAFCAKNSKGKIVPVQEEGWAKPDEVPTHIILKFDSSHGSDYTGTVGNTLWLDNIKLEY